MRRTPWLHRSFAAGIFLAAANTPAGVSQEQGAHASHMNPPVPAIQLTADMPGDIRCDVSGRFTQLGHALPKVARKLEQNEALTIVAIGSSSTAGTGATSPFTAYPARLQGEMRRMFQNERITVLNRGVGGERAGDMQARLEQSVLAEKPDLVIFQGDVNSILADVPLEPAMRAMDSIIRTLRARDIEVVLMDSQFAPRVTMMPGAGPMLASMDRMQAEHRIGRFHRHALMQYWHEKEGLGFSQFLAPDSLHMNDWSYACIARVLAHAIGNATSPYPGSRPRF